ncbi:thrombomodulin [Fundulus heteroclitus]|uniref:thrombomodulin n=1 Tax=Fundulus heteroclitus TaxID=8078 RepID=UPI00165C5DF5|nr:thrombomodulin [Fundulus heteroclitus]
MLFFSASMNLITPTLFFCGLFLQEAAASQRARCSGDLCLFQRSAGFNAAERECQESDGQLVQSGADDQMTALKRLMIDVSGRFWLHGGPNCTAVSGGRGRNVTVLSEPCRSTLDGFLCLYDPSSVCSAVQSAGGNFVTYSTSRGFVVLDSETFPPGTLALVVPRNAHYPDSKYLCLSHWLQAPWTCEVLEGGCDHECNKTANTCMCPPAHSLHHNNISCAEPTGVPSEIQGCPRGYKLAADGRSCEDVNECADDPCIEEGEHCVNLDGGYDCRCADDFIEEDGRCVNISICSLCEHMKCDKISGVYQCVCNEGFRVSPRDPTMCERDCQRECPAICNPNPDLEKKDMQQCFCPDNYILDIREGTATCYDIDECEAQAMCDHQCENLFGGFRCTCRKGYTLQGKEKCVRLQGASEEEEGEEEASGSPPPILAPASTPISLQPAAVPSYVKTGSVLGITVFLGLCVVLLVCVVRTAARRCGRLTLNSLKPRDIDIFYLQQITTETYKRLSFDKPFKNEPQRV